MGSNLATPSQPKDQVYEKSGFYSRDPKTGEITQNPILNMDGSIKDGFSLNYGNVMPQVQEQLNGINLDHSGIDAIRARATSAPGTVSPWLALQQQGLQTNLAQQRDDASAQGASSLANSESQLARAGGLGGGASERLAHGAMLNRDQQMQQIARTGLTEGNKLQVADEETKNNMLMALPGLENTANQGEFQKAGIITNQLNQQNQGQYNASQANLQTVMNELNAKRGFDVNQYNEKMKAWAAGKTADAQASAGKK